MTDGNIQRRGGLLATLVTVPLALLVLLTGALVVTAVREGGTHVPFILIYYTPMALYMAAIVMVRSGLKRIAAGDLFPAVLPGLMVRVGAALLAGALLTELGVPLLSWLVMGSPYVKTFEPSAVTLGIVGAMLLLVGQLFGRASADRRELEQFF